MSELANLLGAPIVLAFIAGGVWANFLYMRHHMVTKKDLTLVVWQFAASIQKHFTNKQECAIMHGKQPTNGSAFPDIPFLDKN